MHSLIPANTERYDRDYAQYREISNTDYCYDDTTRQDQAVEIEIRFSERGLGHRFAELWCNLSYEKIFDYHIQNLKKKDTLHPKCR